MKWFWFCVVLIISFGILATLRNTAAISPLITTTQQAAKNDEISIGWVGDMVPASDDLFNTSALSGVSLLTQRPSLMIGNLEGTFAATSRPSKCLYLSINCHAFRGDMSFAYALKHAGFDLLSLVNNHSYDYGAPGLEDTESILDAVGIPYISQTHPSTSLTVDGKKVGVLGVSFTPPFSTITNYDFITREITSLRQTNDIVILIFHGGAEGPDKTAVTGDYEYLGDENRGNVELVAHTAIDAGADIVFGSGPHVLRKVYYHKDKPIIYSAGNFVGGNSRLTTTGILGISALFTVVQHNDEFTHTVTPITLSKNGVPSIDPDGQALTLLESLSK
jgi:poly-gamma-glutamate capsule biosynthesis protein CapA/YwtB (metallophosphatase superfamily)